MINIIRIAAKRYNTFVRYSFNSNKQDYARMIRAKHQERQLKRMHDEIQNTPGKLNLLKMYLKFYSNNVMIGIAVLVSLGMLWTVYKMGGQYIDPLSKKKMLLFLNDQKQGEFDQYLCKIISNNYLAQNKEIPKVSESAKLKLNAILQQIQKKCGKKYRFEVINSPQQILIVLPKTIFVSKNLLSKSSEPYLHELVFLMVALSLRKYHIKELSLKELTIFLTDHSDSAGYDIKYTQIYTRPYSFKQIDQTIKLMKEKWNIDAQSIQKALKWVLKQQNTCQNVGSIKKRLIDASQ